MQCPSCETSVLQSRKLRDSQVVIDKCEVCRGLWFEDNELAEFLPTAVTDLKPIMDSLPSGIDCPACNREMVAFNYPQTLVEIDMCTSCRGLWLTPDKVREINAVREDRKKNGKLDVLPPLSGIKGHLIRFIDSAIAKLRDFD